MNEKKKMTQCLNMAKNFLSYRARTIKEMQRYIEKKGFSDDISQKTIKILIDYNYLNDKEFVKLFLKTKTKTTPKSKFAFQYELEKKGINSCDIEAVLMTYDDQDLAIKAVKPKIKTWQNFDTDKFKKKLLNFLKYRGFNYDISMSTMTLFLESHLLKKDEKYEN